MTRSKKSKGNIGEHPGSTRSGADRPPWDEAAALKATGGDADLARELLDTLLGSLPGQLSTLQDLWATQDWQGLDDTVHRMRGATAYCAVPALDQALVELKYAAKSRDATKIAAGLSRIDLEVHRLRLAIG